ncbi:hypothetical protein C2S52_008105 [Perilla frutescens var. hirtella]|nr:hypothetical protein C2S52_008105 [Perilla frutescens var. hirtella]
MSEEGSEPGSEYTNDTRSVVRSDKGVEGESVGADRSGLEIESDGETYATTAFVETHSVPPVASSKEISGRILAALKVIDLSFDTIVGRKKRSVSGDPGRN